MGLLPPDPDGGIKGLSLPALAPRVGRPGPGEPGGRVQVRQALQARARTALKLALERARAEDGPVVGTGHLLAGVLAEGGNLALHVLGALEINVAQLTETLARTDQGGEPGEEGAAAGEAAESALRFSAAAAAALELTVNEALALGHNYIGCEHLLLGLVAEPDGAGGGLLRELGAEQRLTRRAVVAALAGYVHLRATQPQPQPSADQLRAVTETVRAELQAELRPLAERIARLEARG
ncbi:hypothetical protein OG500_06810 [Kitasatospora sp. NBC_01250]